MTLQESYIELNEWLIKLLRQSKSILIPLFTTKELINIFQSIKHIEEIKEDSLSGTTSSLNRVGLDAKILSAQTSTTASLLGADYSAEVITLNEHLNKLKEDIEELRLKLVQSGLLTNP